MNTEKKFCKQKVSISVFFFLCGYALVCIANGEEAGRERLSMDFGWKFSLGHLSDADKDFGYSVVRTKTGRANGPPHIDFDDHEWDEVDLPHDWAVALDSARDGMRSHSYKKLGRNYPENSIGWYRKSFAIPREDSGRRITIEFDGVFRDCDVWLNGHPVWHHQSGYTSFGVNVSDYINYGDKNVLVVRVDASGAELWSYEGAGIYRHVRLVKTNPVHMALWGTYVTSEVEQHGDKASAELTVKTTILNEQDGKVNFELETTIVAPDGKQAAAVKSEELIGTWGNEEITQKVKVRDAMLWSVDYPNLYTMKTTVKKGSKIIDAYETTFGIRSIKFDAEEGFFLNGKPVKLKGVCMHQDHGGVGVALPDRVQEYRIAKLKEMGCNSLRTAHNWVAPEVLQACDKLGMVVMNENRMSGSSKEIMEQLESMVKRDRNHPSVIMWSLGNEEMVIQGKEIGERVFSSMKRLVRELDPTRPVILALNWAWDSPVSQMIDILGCNYMNYRGNVEAMHEQFDNRPMLLSESSCTLTTRGIYGSDEMGRHPAYDYRSNAARFGAPAEQMWQNVDSRRWLAGTFVWTGMDYGGESRWPLLHSQCGIMDHTCFPKDNYYYYQSWWSNEMVLHVLPHWNWSGKEGQEIEIWCHSNCDEVELIANGESIGRKTMPRNSHLEWTAEYEPGYIEVKGYKEDKLVATKKIETTGEPAAIRLKPDRTKIKADNMDVSLVTVEVVDDKGRVVPTANNEISFSISDNGKIIGVCNGDPGCHIPEKGTTYPVFNGLMMVFVQSGWDAGEITLEALSKGLRTAKVGIEARACKVEPYVAAFMEKNIGANIEPGGGYFTDFKDVAVRLRTPTKGAELRYRIDGETPGSNSILYTEPLKLSGPVTIMAQAFKDGEPIGSVATAVFKKVTVPFKTDEIFPGDSARYVKVSVRGAKLLRLSPPSMMINIAYDEYDWAEPRLITENREVMYLSNLKEVSKTLGGVAEDEVVYEFYEDYEYFEAYIGRADVDSDKQTGMRFSVTAQ
ncbi:beta-galactosidase GalA [Planctomycetota bacterium]